MFSTTKVKFVWQYVHWIRCAAIRSLSITNISTPDYFPIKIIWGVFVIQRRNVYASDSASLPEVLIRSLSISWLCRIILRILIHKLTGRRDVLITNSDLLNQLWRVTSELNHLLYSREHSKEKALTECWTNHIGGCGMPKYLWRNAFVCDSISKHEICGSFLPRKFPTIQYQQVSFIIIFSLKIIQHQCYSKGCSLIPILYSALDLQTDKCIAMEAVSFSLPIPYMGTGPGWYGNELWHTNLYVKHYRLITWYLSYPYPPPSMWF